MNGSMLATPDATAEHSRPKLDVGIVVWHPQYSDLHVWMGEDGTPTGSTCLFRVLSVRERHDRTHSGTHSELRMVLSADVSERRVTQGCGWSSVGKRERCAAVLTAAVSSPA